MQRDTPTTHSALVVLRLSGKAEGQIGKFAPDEELRPGFPAKLSSTPPLTNGNGTSPESRLLEKLREFGKSLLRLAGTFPVRQLLDRSSTLRDFRDERDSGISELSSLFCSISRFSDFRLPISQGIGPDKRFALRSILTRLVAQAISGGILPEIRFPCMKSSDKFFAARISSGIGPVNLANIPGGILPSKLLLLTRNRMSDSHSAYEAGISPEREFWRIRRNLSFPMLQSPSGSGPDSWFSDKSSPTRPDNRPSPDGTRPVR
ncbi:cytochrome c550 [Striga asiatica]|uniref:Cytochrome c550 n=1 Tax=Striga asiatica TaxID=4170 RepID=A0A5A7Q4V2_STRAF|nr:cytochrome c550 [Striga asiatica]